MIIVKKQYIAILIYAFFVPSIVFAAEDSGFFEAVDFKLKIENRNVQLDEPLYIKNDRLYVPLRNMCDTLGIPIEWDDNTKEATLNVYDKSIKVSSKTELNEEGVIPDGETALAIGKAILESYMGRPVEYETETEIFYLRAEFLQEKNAWRVIQNFKFKDGIAGGIDGGEFINIEINKNTGEVLYINTYSTFEN